MSGIYNPEVDITELTELTDMINSLPDDDPRLLRMDKIPDDGLWDIERVGDRLKLRKSAALRAALTGA